MSELAALRLGYLPGEAARLAERSVGEWRPADLDRRRPRPSLASTARAAASADGAATSSSCSDGPRSPSPASRSPRRRRAAARRAPRCEISLGAAAGERARRARHGPRARGVARPSRPRRRTWLVRREVGRSAGGEGRGHDGHPCRQRRRRARRAGSCSAPIRSATFPTASSPKRRFAQCRSWWRSPPMRTIPTAWPTSCSRSRPTVSVRVRRRTSRAGCRALPRRSCRPASPGRRGWSPPRSRDCLGADLGFDTLESITDEIERVVAVAPRACPVDRFASPGDARDGVVPDCRSGQSSRSIGVRRRVGRYSPDRPDRDAGYRLGRRAGRAAPRRRRRCRSVEARRRRGSPLGGRPGRSSLSAESWRVVVAPRLDAYSHRVSCCAAVSTTAARSSQPSPSLARLGDARRFAWTPPSSRGSASQAASGCALDRPAAPSRSAHADEDDRPSRRRVVRSRQDEAATTMVRRPRSTADALATDVRLETI